MNKKKVILVMSTQYPGYGGAATNAYALIKYLRTLEYFVFGIFIEDRSDVDIDPEKIGNIYHMKYKLFNSTDKIILRKYRYFFDSIIGNSPSIILCKNYFTPYCSKLLYPDVRNVYLVSGIVSIIDHYHYIPVQKLIESNIPLVQTKNDIIAIMNSDLVVANSPLTHKLLYLCYSDFKNKFYPNPIDTSKYIEHLIDVGKGYEWEFIKKYDFIIVSTILTRQEKNNLFLVDIIKDSRINNYVKIIVGEDNDRFADIPNTIKHGLLSHRELMNLMKQTKILLYPSLYDSNPNTVREAIYNKCMVLISNNVGYHEKFPEYSVCKTYDLQEWISKSLYLIEKYDELIKEYTIDFDSEDIDILIDKVI